jgi:hypothetical protein
MQSDAGGRLSFPRATEMGESSGRPKESFMKQETRVKWGKARVTLTCEWTLVIRPPKHLHKP